MNAHRWLGDDGYQYILFCTKNDAAEIIARFGPTSKAPTLRSDDGIKYSHYLINTNDRIITPIRYLSWVFGGHVDEPLIGNECSIALFLDHYHFREYPANITAETWNGPGDYDVFLTLNDQGMQKLTEYYDIDPELWKYSSMDRQYFCLASLSRKAIALLPHLALAFGGMYDELPMAGNTHPIRINYDDYVLEEFSFKM